MLLVLEDTFIISFFSSPGHARLVFIGTEILWNLLENGSEILVKLTKRLPLLSFVSNDFKKILGWKRANINRMHKVLLNLFFKFH